VELPKMCDYRTTRWKIICHPKKMNNILNVLGEAFGEEQLKFAVFQFIQDPNMTINKFVPRSMLERLINFETWGAFWRYLTAPNFEWADWWEMFDPEKEEKVITVPSDDFMMIDLDKIEIPLFEKPERLPIKKHDDMMDSLLFALDIKRHIIKENLV